MGEMLKFGVFQRLIKIKLQIICNFGYKERPLSYQYVKGILVGRSNRAF